MSNSFRKTVLATAIVSAFGYSNTVIAQEQSVDEEAMEVKAGLRCVRSFEFNFLPKLAKNLFWTVEPKL